jgi:hypothetical protein
MAAKSGVTGRGSEQCLRNRSRSSKRGSSDGQKRAVVTPLISQGLVWWKIRCVEGKGSGTMRQKVSQIGNPDFEGLPKEVSSGGLLLKARAGLFSGRRNSTRMTNNTGDRTNADGSLVPYRAKQGPPILRFLVVASCYGGWMLLKNWIRILIGREPDSDKRGLFVWRFLWQYVLHLTGLRPIRKITCLGLKSEGAGSQALDIMNAMNFARSSGLTYVHTPFTFIQHADRPMEEWVTAWETLFNLGAGEAVFEGDRREVVSYCHSVAALELCLGWSHRRDELAQSFRAMIPEFRRKYYLNKSPRTTDEVTVAVHIRRGDSTADNPHYFTSNETVLGTITAVKSLLETHKLNYRIRVYSQGNRSDFPELSLPDVEFFLDVDAIWTMEQLIEADVLVMAKGYFSYYAALISDGIKIYEPIDWAPGLPDDNWIPRLSDGSFDCAVFERQLSVLIQAKAVDATFAVGSDRQRPSA